MKVGLVYEKTKLTIDVGDNDTIGNMKAFLKDHLCLNMKASGETEDLFLHIKFAGSYLQDDWILADIGILPGSTLQCILQSREKTFLRAYSVFNNKYYDFITPMSVASTNIEVLKGLVQDLSGIPVSMFRLCKKPGELELHDAKVLADYDIRIGDTVYIDIWDGMSDFLVSVFAGEVTDTMDLIVGIFDDPMLHRYQLRVALFIASFQGNIQLAAQLLKSGARCDDPVGEHPARDWCKALVAHPSSLRTPAHAAAQCGRISCLRLFIHHNRACILSKDGNDHTPLAMARRYGQRDIFKLLVTEQFRTIQYAGLSLSTYGKVRKWCDRAKDRVAYYRLDSNRSMLLASGDKTGLSANVGSLIQLSGFGETIQTSAPKLNKRKLAAKNQWLWPKRDELAGLSIDNKPTPLPPLRRQNTYFERKRLAKRTSSLESRTRGRNQKKDLLRYTTDKKSNERTILPATIEKKRVSISDARFQPSNQVPNARFHPSDQAPDARFHPSNQAPNARFQASVNTESCSCDDYNKISTKNPHRDVTGLPNIRRKAQTNETGNNMNGFFITQDVTDSGNHHPDNTDGLRTGTSKGASANEGGKRGSTGRNKPSRSSARSLPSANTLLAEEAHAVIERATGQSSEQLARLSLELGDSFTGMGWLKRLQLATNYNRNTLLRGMGDKCHSSNEINH